MSDNERIEFEFQVLQSNLAPALAKVARAVATRSTLPVLSNILVVALPEGRLRLAATNLEIGIVCYVSAKVKAPGGTTLPARTFVDFVNALSSDDLLEFTLKVRTETTTIRRPHQGKRKGEGNIRGITDEEFPLLPAHDVVLARLPGEVLARSLGKVVPCAATDEGRPILNGVLMTFKGKKLTCAATDGYRLSVSHLALPEPVEKDLALIVPAHALAEVAKLMAKEPTVTINTNTSKSSVQFAGESMEITSQLIDGNFPDYQQIIPKKHEVEAIVNRKALIARAKAASVFARESKHIFEIEVGDQELAISATSAETGSNEDGLDAVTTGALTFALNGTYLMDALESLDTSEVVIRGTTADRPFTVRGKDDGDDLFVIMPMHLGRDADTPPPAQAASPATSPTPVPAQVAGHAPTVSA